MRSSIAYTVKLYRRNMSRVMIHVCRNEFDSFKNITVFSPNLSEHTHTDTLTHTQIQTHTHKHKTNIHTHTRTNKHTHSFRVLLF